MREMGVRGRRVSASSFTGPIDTSGGSHVISNSGAYAFNGLMNDVRVSSVVRSSDWIATEYNNQSNPSTFYGAGGANSPSISSLSPTQPMAGKAVTIAGVFFGSTQGTSTVSFNGVAATPTNWSATSITAPDQTYTQFAYDYRGRRISITDANGKTTAYQYDDADRLVAVTDAAQNSTIYGYDTENNLVGITDAANHQTTFAYDALGRVTAVTFPSTLSEGYTYDAVNNLLSKTDRKNQTIQYGYDALYRLTSKTYPDSTAVNYTYDPLSRLTQVTDPTGAYSFTYDNLGRLLGTGTQYSFLSSALNNSYTYDAASNRISFSNAQSQITNYSYDSLNRLTTLTDPTTGQFGFGYDALGRRTSLTRPNGVSTSYSYDTLSRLLSVLHGGGNLPGSAAYTYDAAGNRLSKTAVQEASPSPVSVLSQYSYDPIYELTQAVVNGSVAEGYSYDAVGNRLTSVNPASYSYNASNELTSSSAATYTYDGNGNTRSKTDSTGTTYYTWDYENRLTSLTLPGTGGTVDFTYDPFGRRIRKAFGTATTVYAYDGDNAVEELGGGGNLLARYTQGAGIDEPLALTGAGGAFFYEADGLGSVTSVTDSTGNVAASYVYDSFGKLTASTGTITNPFQYTAREFDSESGLYNYRARYYDPTVGHFLREDPARFWAGVNFYRYVDNDPIDEFDPFGLDPPNKGDLLRRVICNKACADYLGGLKNVLRAIADTKYVDMSDPRATVPPWVQKMFADNPMTAAVTAIGGSTTYYRPPPEDSNLILDSVTFLHELRHVLGHGAEIDKDYKTEYSTIEKLCPEPQAPTVTVPVNGVIQ